jgi:preprotein translocase subunit SecD
MENTLEKIGLQTPVKVDHATPEAGWVASSWRAFGTSFCCFHETGRPGHRGDTLEQISRGFLPLVALRVLTVVNDNVLRWLAIGLGKKAVAESQVWLVLTIGTAVDSNVLIYERIREEARLGRSMISSLEAGFQRAFATIIDSNVTMFIAAAILFLLGTGPVKGFAVTLVLGIVTTVVTAVTMTRMMIALWYRWARPTRLPF